MKKLIGWQVYTVALVAVGYVVFLQMGVGQTSSSILAMLAVLVSLMVLAACKVPVASTVFFTAVLFGLLAQFAIVATPSLFIGFNSALLLALFVACGATICSVIASGMERSNTPELRFLPVFTGYCVQGGLVSIIAIG
jgi:hypothetical protein